jgi:hypothetical protein
VSDDIMPHHAISSFLEGSTQPMSHVVLLGDSIFDNGRPELNAYVRPLAIPRRPEYPAPVP